MGPNQALHATPVSAGVSDHRGHMKLQWLPLLLALTACASYYVAPEGPTAILQLDSNTSPVFVQHFKNAKCEKAPEGTRISYLHPSFGDQTGVTKTIAAGEPFLITFHKAHLSPYTSGMECTVSGIFIPEPGKSYRAVFRFDGHGCQLGVLESGSAPSDYKPLKSFTSVTPPCFAAIAE